MAWGKHAPKDTSDIQRADRSNEYIGLNFDVHKVRGKTSDPLLLWVEDLFLSVLIYEKKHT